MLQSTGKIPQNSNDRILYVTYTIDSSNNILAGQVPYAKELCLEFKSLNTT